MNVDVMLITHNEEKNLPHALDSVRGWANRVFVLDSGSTDKTEEIARARGADFRHLDWLGYARQKNWGLDHLPFASDWVLILDADEAVLPDLRAAIERVVTPPPDAVPEAGFYINRYFIFLGKRIRHCGYYPSWNLRLFKRGRARYEEREVHEHMVVDGPVGYLKGHLEHSDRRGLEHAMAKHNRYSTLEAAAVLRAQREGSDGLPPRLFGNALERRRWVKERLYPRLPAKWLWRFAYMYVVRLGFLDGLTGLRFCLFMTAYELLIGLKMVELRLEEREAKRAATDG